MVFQKPTNGTAKIPSHALNADPSSMATMPPTPPKTITASYSVSPIPALTNNAPSLTPAIINKRDAAGAPEDENRSPKKLFIDFSRPKSKENSLLLGDNSDKWLIEEDQMAAMVTQKNTKENELACALKDPVEEVYEWEAILDAHNIDNDKGTGVVTVEYKTIEVRLEFKVDELKAICRNLKLPVKL